MLTTGNAATDALLRSGARQIPHLDFVLVSGEELSIGSDRVMQNGISIKRSAFTNGNIEIGTAISADMQASLYNTDGFFDDYDLGGASCHVSISVVDNGTERSVSMGYFTIDSVEDKGKTIEIKGLDCLAELDVLYKDGDIPSTVFPNSLTNVFLAVQAALFSRGIYVAFSFLATLDIPRTTILKMPKKTE